MEIGKPERTIIVEPVEDPFAIPADPSPVELPAPAPAPAELPEPAPVGPPSEEGW